MREGEEKYARYPKKAKQNKHFFGGFSSSSFWLNGGLGFWSGLEGGSSVIELSIFPHLKQRKWEWAAKPNSRKKEKERLLERSHYLTLPKTIVYLFPILNF